MVKPAERQVLDRIHLLVDSVRDDPTQSSELFQYVWAMVCVREGLMRVVRETETRGGCQVVLEERATGNHRIVARPACLDLEVEGLAVQALSHILAARAGVR